MLITLNHATNILGQHTDSLSVMVAVMKMGAVSGVLSNYFDDEQHGSEQKYNVL